MKYQDWRWKHRKLIREHKERLEQESNAKLADISKFIGKILEPWE